MIPTIKQTCKTVMYTDEQFDRILNEWDRDRQQRKVDLFRGVQIGILISMGLVFITTLLVYYGGI